VTAVTLTQTAKKTRDHKASIISDVRSAVDSHTTLYLFSYENMRSNKFKAIRLHFRDEDDAADVAQESQSKILLGKNKLLQIALGRNEEEEYSTNLRKVAKLTTGSVGLLFTSLPESDVEAYFERLAEEDFARAGSVSPRRVVVTNEEVLNHPVSMVEQFRKLGLPVEVQNGSVVLIGKSDHTICKEGETLSAEACKLLVHFGYQLAEFKVKLVCRWSRQDATDGEFEMLE
jgi:mRNA turnover protein 4